MIPLPIRSSRPNPEMDAAILAGLRLFWLLPAVMSVYWLGHVALGHHRDVVERGETRFVYTHRFGRRLFDTTTSLAFALGSAAVIVVALRDQYWLTKVLVVPVGLFLVVAALLDVVDTNEWVILDRKSLRLVRRSRFFGAGEELPFDAFARLTIERGPRKPRIPSRYRVVVEGTKEGEPLATYDKEVDAKRFLERLCDAAGVGEGR